MSTGRNPSESDKIARDVVTHFCERLSERDLPGMFDILSDNANWTIIGDPEKCFFSGVHSRKDVHTILDSFLGAFDRFSFDVTRIISEGEYVAVQANSRGVGPGRKEYVNKYLMQYHVVDGRILEVIEYFDPYQVFSYIDSES